MQMGGRSLAGREPSAHIRALVADLDSRDLKARQQARDRLIEMGEAAVPALVEVLSHPHWLKRWEAAQALSRIAAPATAPALAHCVLVDDYDDIRWLCEKGLIALGEKGLPAVLRLLIHAADSVQVQQGAYHILHALARRGIRRPVEPLLAALRGPEPPAEVPLAAYALLQEVESAR